MGHLKKAGVGITALSGLLNVSLQRFEEQLDKMRESKLGKNMHRKNTVQI